jgi:hypothetical protein
MTAGNGSYQQSRRAKERRRRVIENVHLAFRPELREEFRRHLRRRSIPPPARALHDLATAPDIRRLLKHRLLIDALRRAPAGLVAELDDPAREVLAATMHGDQQPPGGTVDDAKQELDKVIAMPGDARLRAEHWAEWVRRTDEMFHYTVHERSFQACDDERTVRKRRRPDGSLVDCRLIVAQFWSNRPPTAFTRYINPKNWAACSAFWRDIQQIPPEIKRGLGYDSDFVETVNYLGTTLVVPLQVAFRVRPEQGRVWTRFNIAPTRFDQKVPVDVDTGIVSARSMPGGPAPTLVRATKYLHWNGNPPDLTKLACDFGAVDSMVEMADACLEPSMPIESTEATEPAAATGSSVDDAIKRLVEDIVTQCRDGISASGPHLEKLIGRFTGRSWDARWINDLLAMGLVTADRYGSIASSVRRFADSLRDAEDREDGA